MSNIEKFIEQNKYKKTHFGSGRMSTLDRYKQYLIKGDRAKIKITPQDEKILSRINAAYAMLLKHTPVMSKREITKVLARQFKVSERQALYDINSAEEIYGDVHRVHKKFEKVRLTSWLQDLVTVTFASKDFKTALEAIKQLAIINEINVPDEELQDDTPKTFNLNIIVNTDDGPKVITHDIDKLDELSFAEFELLSSSLNQPRVGVKNMENLLDEYEEPHLESSAD